MTQLTTAWAERMFALFPHPQPDADDIDEMNVWLNRFFMWAAAKDPEGTKAFEHHCRLAAAEEIVTEYMAERIAAGEYVRQVGDDGTVYYSRVGA
jgi:hypothetical protein